MDALTLFLAYLGLIAGLVFVLLFGELHAFQGTPVARCHSFLTVDIFQGIQCAPSPPAPCCPFPGAFWVLPRPAVPCCRSSAAQGVA